MDELIGKVLVTASSQGKKIKKFLKSVTYVTDFLLILLYHSIIGNSKSLSHLKRFINLFYYRLKEN